jgi:hypothetical protein
MCQDPDRPSLESHLMRFFCIGFRYRNDVAICINLYLRGCVVHFRKYGLPYGLSVSLCTLHLMVTHFDATLGMGGWLDLTQQGLSPCKKYKTSWRSSVKSYRMIELVHLSLFIFIASYASQNLLFSIFSTAYKVSHFLQKQNLTCVLPFSGFE